MNEDKIFENKEKFIEWLSAKNDYKMAGFDVDDDLYEKGEFERGNQKIDRAILTNLINGTHKPW